MTDIIPIVASDSDAARLVKINGNFAALKSSFFGSNLALATRGQMWLDNAGKILYIQPTGVAGDTSVLFPDITASGGGLLKTAGGTMTGALDAGGFVLTGLGTAVGATDALSLGQYTASTFQRSFCIGAIAATMSVPAFIAPAACTVQAVTLVSNTATTGSNGTNHYTFKVVNMTGSIDLNTAAKDTNGADIGLFTAYDLGCDQNRTLALGDVLKLVITKNAVPTTLATAWLSGWVNYVLV